MKHFKLMKGVLACLLSLALVFSCFTTVGAKAAGESSTSGATVTAPTAVDATYDWAKNVIKSTVNQKAYVYVLKAEKGNTIKAGASANGQLDKGEISLTDLKVKANNKDTYFYVCDKEFEAEGKSINANLVIKATAVKKATVTVDYTKADSDTSYQVISATATDKAGKKLENISVYWSTEANGTYCNVDDDSDSTTRKYADNKTAAKNGFNGKTLRETLEAGGGIIYVKIAGTDGASGSAQFASKAIKVKIVKQGKAPSVKLDVKKDTLSIKNGMDFGLFTKTTNNGTDTYTLVGQWNTVLPFLKTAATKTLADSVVLGSTYLPLGKKAENASKGVTDGKVSYTQLKVKTLGFADLTKQLVTSSSGTATADTVDAGTYYVGVRTAATDKKPASAVTYFHLVGKTLEPIVYTQDKVEGQYLVASGTDFKKGIALGTIANYNGEDGTTGYDDTFALVTGNSGADTNDASYEYTIVKRADFVPSESGEQNIDWSTVSWKKLDPAKTKINSKMKSKYNDLSGKKIEATLKAGTLSTSGETVVYPTGNGLGQIPSSVDTLILVRRTGIKGKTADDAVLASREIVLYIVKNGSNYEIYSTKSVGDKAAQYTFNFYKGSASGESIVWTKDDSLTITGWGGGYSGENTATTTEYVSFPEVTGADFFELTNVENGTLSGEKVSSVSGGTNIGKYSVDVTGETATVKNIAIREYANVKIVAEISISGQTTKTEETLVTITNGKSSISGDNTVYYVGKEIVIPSGSGAAVSSISGYDLGNATSVSGGVTVDGSNFKGTVYTAEETVLKVAYTRTAHPYTFDAPNGDFTFTATSGVTSGKCTCENDIVFTVAKLTTDGAKAIKEVKYTINGVTKSLTLGDSYTIPKAEILGDVSFTITLEA